MNEETERVEQLPELVDNSARFTEAKAEAQPDEGKIPPREVARSTIKYPRVGSLLTYEGQLFVVTKELKRNRFVVRWKKGSE